MSDLLTLSKESAFIHFGKLHNVFLFVHSKAIVPVHLQTSFYQYPFSIFNVILSEECDYQRYLTTCFHFIQTHPLYRPRGKMMCIHYIVNPSKFRKKHRHVFLDTIRSEIPRERADRIIKSDGSILETTEEYFVQPIKDAMMTIKQQNTSVIDDLYFYGHYYGIGTILTYIQKQITPPKKK